MGPRIRNLVARPVGTVQVRLREGPMALGLETRGADTGCDDPSGGSWGSSQPIGRSPRPASGRRHRRRWPWILGAVVFVLGGGVAVMWLSSSRAIPVTMGQAESRLGKNVGDSSDGSRPPAGVYAYRGSGTDRLSFPPLSQPEGPTMPGTVALEKGDCWTFRIDYSSHHWESWDYCLRQGVAAADRRTGVATVVQSDSSRRRTSPPFTARLGPWLFRPDLWTGRAGRRGVSV